MTPALAAMDQDRLNELLADVTRLQRRGMAPEAFLQAVAALPGAQGLDDATLAAIIIAAEQEDDFPRTDSGNAEFFAHHTDGRVIYDHGRREFFIFDGHHWRPDRDGQVARLALEAIRARQRIAFGLTDADQRKAALSWALKSEARTSRDNLVKLAASHRTIADSGDSWDTDPMLFGVRNGVIDLVTGQLRQGRAADRITKLAPVDYDPHARCPRFEQFIAEIFADQADLPTYTQRVVGYAMTGITTEQCFWIWWGSGANGKSTLEETLHNHVLGLDYCWTMPFPGGGWSNAATEYQKASLVQRRKVSASEIQRRGTLNEELIKSLTGNDQINARHPYGRPFTYTPVAKIFLRVNDKPIIRDQSHGMWRRVKLVPFTQTFGVNPSLADELKAEAPGILAWAVRGCLEWQRDGLRHPAVVEAATHAYQDESDPLAEFFDAQCVLAEGVSIGAQQLFGAYKQWAEQTRIKPEDRVNQKTFGQLVRKRFAVNEGRHVTYVGIGLLATTSVPDQGYDIREEL